MIPMSKVLREKITTTQLVLNLLPVVVMAVYSIKICISYPESFFRDMSSVQGSGFFYQVWQITDMVAYAFITLLFVIKPMVAIILTGSFYLFHRSTFATRLNDVLPAINGNGLKLFIVSFGLDHYAALGLPFEMMLLMLIVAVLLTLLNVKFSLLQVRESPYQSKSVSLFDFSVDTRPLEEWERKTSLRNLL